jgi:hypothetical protein
MLHQLTPKETDCSVHIAAGTHFDNIIVEHIGPISIPGDFDLEYLTLALYHIAGQTNEEDTDNLYEDKSSDDDNLDPIFIPKTGDNYIFAKVMLLMMMSWHLDRDEVRAVSIRVPVLIQILFCKL